MWDSNEQVLQYFSVFVMWDRNEQVLQYFFMVCLVEGS